VNAPPTIPRLRTVTIGSGDINKKPTSGIRFGGTDRGLESGIYTSYTSPTVARGGNKPAFALSIESNGSDRYVDDDGEGMEMVSRSPDAYNTYGRDANGNGSHGLPRIEARGPTDEGRYQNDNAWSNSATAGRTHS